MSCPKCIAPKYTSVPCHGYVGSHRFCHREGCGFVWSQHDPSARRRISDEDYERVEWTAKYRRIIAEAADKVNGRYDHSPKRLADVPHLRVIDGGKDDDDAVYFHEGEVPW